MIFDIVSKLNYLESESDSLKSIQRICNVTVFFLPDILYRLCRNRNLKDGNRISRSGTNTWFLFRSTPNYDFTAQEYKYRAVIHKDNYNLLQSDIFKNRYF